MRDKTYSLKLGYKILAWLMFIFVTLLGIYFLDHAIKENAVDKLGRWCYKHCLFSGFMFVCSFFICYGMVRFLFLKVKFLKDGIYIQKLSTNLTITRQMIEDMSIQNSGCTIELRKGERIFIPSELNDFKEFKQRLANFYKRPTELRPYLGNRQVFIEKKRKRR